MLVLTVKPVARILLTNCCGPKYVQIFDRSTIPTYFFRHNVDEFNYSTIVEIHLSCIPAVLAVLAVLAILGIIT